jgi:hypothetical protein
MVNGHPVFVLTKEGNSCPSFNHSYDFFIGLQLEYNEVAQFIVYFDFKIIK